MCLSTIRPISICRRHPVKHEHHQHKQIIDHARKRNPRRVSDNPYRKSSTPHVARIITDKNRADGPADHANGGNIIEHCIGHLSHPQMRISRNYRREIPKPIKIFSFDSFCHFEKIIPPHHNHSVATIFAHYEQRL